jgi:glycine oxidase
MIGPRSELDERDPHLRAPLADAFARWPGLAGEIAADSGRVPVFRVCGCLHVAGRREHLPLVMRHAEYLAETGTPAPWLTGTELRDLEPGLGPGVAGGISLPEEAEVDPRALLGALAVAGAARGVRTVEASGVEALAGRAGRVRGIVDARGEEHVAEIVVVATGHPEPAPVPGVPLRPVKGQILRLGVPDGDPMPLTRTIRTPGVYLTARAAGEVVVGASVEEASDRRVTAGGVADLLEEAIETCPELRELELREAAAGLRPATPDGRPVIGPDPGRDVVWAVGGYRHGIMLLPLVAAAADAIAAGADPPDDVAALGPGRLAGARA